MNILDLKEVAELLKQSSSTIYRWVAEGKIPYTQPGRKILFYEKDIEEWLFKKRIPGNDELAVEVDDHLYNLKQT